MVQGAQQRPQNGLRPVAVRMLRTGSLQVNTLTRFFLTLVVLPLRTRLSMQLEILALRHQLAVYQQSGVRARIKPVDRLFRAWLCRIWSGWQDALVLVQPRTVIAWQPERFREHWARIRGRTRSGRPSTAPEVRQLIRRMSRANRCWGSPRIVGELQKLGIEVAKSTVERYMLRRRKPPTPTWPAFLRNHARDLVSIDFFVVPTVRFKMLFVLVVLAHHRRRLVHFNVTEHPTADWTAQQIVQAFPWDTPPKYLLRDRDGVYGARFRRRIRNMDIEEVIIAPHSPWQNPCGSRNRAPRD